MAWDYHWYLLNKSEVPIKVDYELSDWVLFCPDFPEFVVVDEKLSNKLVMDNWNTRPLIQMARTATENALNVLAYDGDTIPNTLPEIPGKFSFKVEVKPEDYSIKSGD